MELELVIWIWNWVIGKENWVVEFQVRRERENREREREREKEGWKWGKIRNNGGHNNGMNSLFIYIFIYAKSLDVECDIYLEGVSIFNCVRN